MDAQDHRIEKQSDEIRDILIGQGEIKAEIRGLHVKVEAFQKAFYEKEEDRDKEIESIWGEIAMLKASKEKHDAIFNQLKGIKVLLWVFLPIFGTGSIIVVGKFIITNFSKIFGIFID